MKIFVIHTKANLCANNSDNKMWIVADNVETANIIAKQHTRQPIMGIEEFDVQNEVIFATERIKSEYQLKGMTDSWYSSEKYYYRS